MEKWELIVIPKSTDDIYDIQILIFENLVEFFLEKEKKKVKKLKTSILNDKISFLGDFLYRMTLIKELILSKD